jgi:hypothetical protein
MLNAVALTTVAVQRLSLWLILLCLWHPRIRAGAQAMPLCGAAPTFLCSGKEK